MKWIYAGVILSGAILRGADATPTITYATHRLERTTLSLPMHELSSQDLDSRAVFLLSRIDGTFTFDEIIDVSGMSRLEALRHLAKLVLLGVLEVR